MTSIHAAPRACMTAGPLRRASEDLRWLFADVTPLGSCQGRRTWLIPQPEEHGVGVSAEGQGMFHAAPNVAALAPIPAQQGTTLAPNLLETPDHPQSL
jgi:hypothetical protein